MGGIVHRNPAGPVSAPLFAPTVFGNLVKPVTYVMKVFCLTINKLTEGTFSRLLSTKCGFWSEIASLAVHVNHACTFYCFNELVTFFERTCSRNGCVYILFRLHRLYRLASMQPGLRDDYQSIYVRLANFIQSWICFIYFKFF